MAGSFVQKLSHVTASNVTAITSSAFGSSTTAGNLLVCTASVWGPSSHNTHAATDSKSNTWAQDAFSEDNSTGNSGASVNSTILGTAGASHTVTVTAAQAGSYFEFDCSEFAGMASSSALDKTAVNKSSTSPNTATTAATTQADEIVVACFCANTNVNPAAIADPPTINGSTTGVVSIGVNQDAPNTIGYEAAYKILASTGTQAVAWTYTTGASGTGAAVATYKAAGGGGNVTAALTGQALASAAGTAAPATDKALSGSALTGAQGTLAPATSIALSGQALSGALTAPTPNISVALTGQALTAAQGTVTAVTGITIALTGQAMSLAQGSLTGDLTTLLSGNAMSLTQGTLRVPQAVDEAFSGGFVFAYEREVGRRARRRREQEQLEEDTESIQEEIDRKIAVLLRKQEYEDERRAELNRLNKLVIDFAKERSDLSDRVQKAYVRALTQANFSALEALDRELQRMLEEEEITALMILLNEGLNDE